MQNQYNLAHRDDDVMIDTLATDGIALSELKNALRSGDIRVEGSREFKNLNDTSSLPNDLPYSGEPATFRWPSMTTASKI